MKLWIGAESQADIIDAFRLVRSEVENEINLAIRDVSYDIGVDEWNCIVILRDDSNFTEKIQLSKAKRDMDFRLRLDYTQFAEATQTCRKILLLKLLLRSLSLLKDKGQNASEIERLADDVMSVGERKGWSGAE